jgi:uncharacterized protein YdeI (YjbR/CyaY-like superfamily)
MIGHIKKAMELNEQSVQPKRPPKHPKKPLRVPPYLLAALEKNRKARTTFESLPPSHKREYVEWITEAKREETRERRLATAMEWLSDGKAMNWKYAK